MNAEKPTARLPSRPAEALISVIDPNAVEKDREWTRFEAFPACSRSSF